VYPKVCVCECECACVFVHLWVEVSTSSLNHFMKLLSCRMMGTQIDTMVLQLDGMVSACVCV
jgi:hypothetical protein